MLFPASPSLGLGHLGPTSRSWLATFLPSLPLLLWQPLDRGIRLPEPEEPAYRAALLPSFLFSLTPPHPFPFFVCLFV